MADQLWWSEYNCLSLPTAYSPSQGGNSIPVVVSSVGSVGPDLCYAEPCRLARAAGCVKVPGLTVN